MVHTVTGHSLVKCVCVPVCVVVVVVILILWRRIGCENVAIHP